MYIHFVHINTVNLCFHVNAVTLPGQQNINRWHRKRNPHTYFQVIPHFVFFWLMVNVLHLLYRAVLYLSGTQSGSQGFSFTHIFTLQWRQGCHWEKLPVGVWPQVCLLHHLNLSSPTLFKTLCLSGNRKYNDDQPWHCWHTRANRPHQMFCSG